MSLFRKNNYINKEISDIGFAERDDAIRSLEEQKLELEKEAEALLRSYARLTGRRLLRKKQWRKKYALTELTKINYHEK